MSEFRRKVTRRYEDPLDRIWRVAAERIGFRVARTPDAYASTDGQRTILVGTPETLDADDSLAQMILHELCHALVEGDAALDRVDWGLDNQTDKDVVREEACLRLQAWLTQAHGLRGFFAPTTDYRAFWDTLGDDPLAADERAGGRREPGCVAARVAVWRAGRAPWAPHLQEALAATAALAAAVPVSGGAADSLWSTIEPPPAPHPLGHAPVGPQAAPPEAATCGACAWRFTDGRRGARCRVAPQAGKVDAAWPACTRWEPASELDCQTCGACCREAYHSVEISRREPVIQRHPELVVVHERYLELKRDGERCAALGGGRAPDERYACRIYQDRPRTCREFTMGSANCLDARRRVGLST